MIFSPIWMHIGRACLARHLQRLQDALLQLYEQIKDELSAVLGRTAGGFARETARLLLGAPRSRGHLWEQPDHLERWYGPEETDWFDCEEDWRDEDRVDRDPFEMQAVRGQDKGLVASPWRQRLWGAGCRLWKQLAAPFLDDPYASLASVFSTGLLIAFAWCLRPILGAAVKSLLVSSE